MPLKILKREVEIEKRVGYSYLQTVARAEVLVPGVGRDAVEVLLRDARIRPVKTDVQTDRVVAECALECQCVYCQGAETTLRGISAKTMVNQSAEIPGALGGMPAHLQPVVEQLSARYENGHMVFQAHIGLHVWVFELEPLEVIDELDGGEAVMARFEELCLTRIAAEANEEVLLSAQVALPNALDARMTLMDWGEVSLDDAQVDLGGIRVKGSAVIETLIASGVEGKPAVPVRYPIEFDRLLELPEWLSAGAQVTAAISKIQTQVSVGEEGESSLDIQAGICFYIASNLKECVKALTDAYSAGAAGIGVKTESFRAVYQVAVSQNTEIIRDSVMLGDQTVVGSVIALRAQPVISQVESREGRSSISGMMDMQILYMPAGADRVSSANAQIGFSVDTQQMIEESSQIDLSVLSAEANALMGDRLEVKIVLRVRCETRIERAYTIVTAAEEAAQPERKPGYVIYYPQPGEDAWQIGKRFLISPAQVEAYASGAKIAPGVPLVLRI